MSKLGLHTSDALAVVDGESAETLSYSELLDRATSAERAFGDRKSLVFLLCSNDLSTVTAYAATQVGGHAVALLDGSIPISAYAALITEYRPDRLIGPIGTRTTLEAAGIPARVVGDVQGYEIIQPEGLGRSELHPDLAVLLATSGTTGSQKYVRLSARNVESNAKAIADYIELTPQDRPVTSLPLHYSFGLSVLNSHWHAGATVVLTARSVIERAFWDVLREHLCTSLAGVPYTFRMLERVGYRDMDLPSVRTMQQAGGGLDRDLVETYRAHMSAKDGRLFVMYGQTEATARIAYVPPERLVDKAGSAGIAIPGGH
jgi:long-chain acyl-CoA synthetase